MRALFDVNVLIALFDPGHIHHNRTHRWWAGNRRAGWATCPLTQNGFVRVSSQSTYANPVSAAVAVEFLAGALSTPQHEFWHDDLSITDPKKFVRDRILGQKQITDLYLLALAVRRGGRLVTFDRTIPLSAVVGAKPDNLVIV
jgi:toxin-antitoxin system PIN domain toxin